MERLLASASLQLVFCVHGKLSVLSSGWIEGWRFILFLLCLFFSFAAIALCILLFLSFFMNIGQSIADILGLTAVSLYEEGKLSFLSITLGILMAVSLFSLWLIKLVRRRNNHMADIHALLDVHFAEGKTLSDEYRHTIS